MRSESNSHEILISVVIPAYNAAKHVADSVTSALRQTLQPFEVLVIDDGSTDGTAAAAEKAGARVITQKNMGVSSARNRGITEAKGDWIAFLDADDRWLPEKLRKQADALGAHPDAVLAASDFAREQRYQTQHAAWMKSRSIYQEMVGKRIDDAVVYLPAEKISAALTQENFFPTSSIMARRLHLRELGGFDERMDYCEDHDLWLRVLHASPAVVVQQSLVIYRMHEASASAQWSRILEGDVHLARLMQLTPHFYNQVAVERSRARLTHSLFALGMHFVRTRKSEAALAPLWESFRRKKSLRTAFWLFAGMAFSFKPRKIASGYFKGNSPLPERQTAPSS
jgi:glycosyltransferase involved in cell wall biosynthesis